MLTATKQAEIADNADPKAQEVYQSIRSQYGVSSLAALSNRVNV